jgi:hypothetical protein
MGYRVFVESGSLHRWKKQQVVSVLLVVKITNAGTRWSCQQRADAHDQLMHLNLP